MGREGFWEFLTVSVVECSFTQFDAVGVTLHQRTSPLQFMETVSMNKHCGDISSKAKMRVYTTSRLQVVKIVLSKKHKGRIPGGGDVHKELRV